MSTIGLSDGSLAGPLDIRMPTLEYFTLSWSVLLTELKLFYNYYYKFLVGSSLGTVERLFVPCQAATNDLFILFLTFKSLSQLRSGF